MKENGAATQGSVAAPRNAATVRKSGQMGVHVEPVSLGEEGAGLHPLGMAVHHSEVRSAVVSRIGLRLVGLGGRASRGRACISAGRFGPSEPPRVAHAVAGVSEDGCFRGPLDDRHRAGSARVVLDVVVHAVPRVRIVLRPVERTASGPWRTRALHDLFVLDVGLDARPPRLAASGIGQEVREHLVVVLRVHQFAQNQLLKSVGVDIFVFCSV